MSHPFHRVSATQLTLPHALDCPITLFATPDVPVQRAAAQELTTFLDRLTHLPTLHGRIPPARLHRVALTPDFHKGAGIPVGTVLHTEGVLFPEAIGNDVACGMGLHTTTLTRDDLEPHLDALEDTLRRVFFQGQRRLSTTGKQREAVLRSGIGALVDTPLHRGQSGLWSRVRDSLPADARQRLHAGGQLPVMSLPAHLDWLREPHHLTHDAQLGSVGGGNHFVELQYVHRLLDRGTAHHWHLKAGQVVVMVHSGSLGFGHLAAQQARTAAQAALPEERVWAALPVRDGGPAHQPVMDALNAAANFAAVNRLCLAAMAAQALSEHLPGTGTSLLYDAPHNFIWPDPAGGWLHRKGATPARGFAGMQGTPFAFTGEPVIVPGSMGGSSFLLAGRGLPEALSSASHGAGRLRSRGEAMRGHDDEFHAFLRDFRVVTPLDWRRARPDIQAQKLRELKQEAPFAYKGIGPVIRTLAESGIAAPVAELRPLITVKG